MKRIILSIGFVLVCSAAFCQQHETEKPLSESTYKVKKTYYGSEARNSNKNPCKGYVSDICAVIEKTVEGLYADTQTKVTTEVYFPLTGETSTQQEILAKSPAETLSDLLGEENEDGSVIVEEVK